MSYTTPTTTQAARKQYVCDWCNEGIVPGEQYARWCWFDDGHAETVKMHGECYYDGLLDLDYDDSWYPGDNPRGCNCGFTVGCERCAAREKA